MMSKRIDLNFKISKFLKFKLEFELEFTFKFIFEKMIYNKIRFKDDKTYVIRLLKMIKINDVEEIERALKPKRFLLIINFDNDSKINYLKIKIKSMQKFKTKSLSLSLSLFEKCSKIFKISKI